MMMMMMMMIKNIGHVRKVYTSQQFVKPYINCIVYTQIDQERRDSFKRAEMIANSTILCTCEYHACMASTVSNRAFQFQDDEKHRM